jgi:hypothetical protein
LGGAAAVLSGVAWYVLLMRKVLAATAFGPICGHTDFLGPHCPACYGALGFAGVSLSLLAASEARRESAIARRVSQ